MKAERGLQGKELLASWEDAKERGLGQKAHAAELGIPFSRYQSRLYRAQAEGNISMPADVPELPGAPGSEDVKIEQVDDGLALESYGGRIKSIDDLVRACKIDLTKYIIESSSVRKWDVVIKHQITGEPVIVPAFYVSVKLLPKVIEAARLDIRPVLVAGRLPKVTREPARVKGRGLVLTDTQWGFRRNVLSGALDPFHDRRALDVALQIAQYERFDRVTWLGDLLDCTEMSDKFVREPGFYFTTQPAIYEGHWWMQQFVKALPGAEHDALEGNHDLRLPLMLVNHALAMHNLQKATDTVELPSMSVPALLGLAELGIAYHDGYPNNETWQGPVRIIHGDIARNAPGSTVAALAAGSLESVIQGHIHRIEQASRTINQRGRLRHIQAVSPGCLCRVDYVVPGHKHGQQWQQGIAVVEWDGDHSTISTIPILDGVAIYRGRRFEARERLADLNADTAPVRRGWSF